MLRHVILIIALKAVMRKRFYIADGNFTELHALWQYEEQFIVDKKEYEVRGRNIDVMIQANGGRVMRANVEKSEGEEGVRNNDVE